MNTRACISFKPYVIVLHPRLKGNAWGTLFDRLTHDGITHINLSALGREFIREQDMGSRFDPHPSAAVHRRIGESLAEYVQYLPGFAH